MTHAIEHQLSRAVVDPNGINLAGDIGLVASGSGRWFSMDSATQLNSTYAFLRTHEYFGMCP